MRNKILALIAGVVLATVGVGVASAAPAVKTATPTFTGGVQPNGTQVQCFDVRAGSATLHMQYAPNAGVTTCPTGFYQVTSQVAGPAGPQGPAGPAGTSNAVAPVTFQVSFSGRLDGGHHGNWATDAGLRTVTVYQHGRVTADKCGAGAVQCWLFTATGGDAGTFRTNDGALSPRLGTAIAGNVSGTFTGTYHEEFYASEAADGSLATLPVVGGSPSTTNWVSLAFPASAVVNTSPGIINYTWVYSAPNTCEGWIDGSGNNDGADSAAGDIAGINACS